VTAGERPTPGAAKPAPSREAAARRQARPAERGAAPAPVPAWLCAGARRWGSRAHRRTRVLPAVSRVAAALRMVGGRRGARPQARRGAIARVAPSMRAPAPAAFAGPAAAASARGAGGAAAPACGAGARPHAGRADWIGAERLMPQGSRLRTAPADRQPPASLTRSPAWSSAPLSEAA
jgi:hypothetical protein